MQGQNERDLGVGKMKEMKNTTVMDGSDLKKLVQNDEVLTSFVNHKFQDLDADRDGKLSVKELQPAIADIGAALGLPDQGTSPDSDHIYTEVLNEFTRGKDRRTSKHKFKEVMSDILLGMAAGLERDPVVILRMDGEDLHEFLTCPASEPELLSMYSEIESTSSSANASLRDYVVKAFEKLTVEQGMPPATDPWVKKHLVEPSLEVLGDGVPVSQETFLGGFRRVAESMARRLKEQPATVAHSQNTFDGSGIRRLLSNKVELDQAVESALKVIPKEKHGKVSKDYLGVALDSLAASACLPPLGAIDEMDGIMMEALKMVDASDGKVVKEGKFKKLVRQVLGSIMLQLDGEPISVSVNSVVQEAAPSSSNLLQP